MKRGFTGYLWAEVGALTGALVLAVPVGLLWAAAVLPFMFEYDEFVGFATGLAIGLVGVGAVLGCRFALRRKALGGGNRTSGALAVVLAGLFLIGWWSSNTSLQSDLLPYLTAVTPLAPLLARWIATLGGRVGTDPSTSDRAA